MKKQKGFAHVIILLIGVVLVGSVGLYIYHRYNTAPKTKIPPLVSGSPSISKDEANKLIQECKATGTYSLHNGDIGLTLKDGTDKKVAGATEQYLRDSQNPACPFTQASME